MLGAGTRYGGMQASGPRYEVRRMAGPLPRTYAAGKEKGGTSYKKKKRGGKYYIGNTPLWGWLPSPVLNDLRSRAT